MPREQLIKLVRQIAGDQLLRDSIKNMQAQVLDVILLLNYVLSMCPKVIVISICPEVN